MRIMFRIAARFYGVRERRALRAAARFRMKSEKFFNRIKGGAR